MENTQQPKSGSISKFILHVHPRRVYAETVRFNLSFGLGGMAAVLLAMLFVSGILQLVNYTPHIDGAYNSVSGMYLTSGIAGFVRNIHFWSANLLIGIVTLHMLRVLLTGAIDGPRRLNWLIGMGLLLLILFANFTGYLLPWDQRAYWAVTIFTSMLTYIPVIGEGLSTLLCGGFEVNEQTLANFFAIHAGILPFALAVLAVWHFWLIRKAGGLVKKGDANDTDSGKLPVFPHLVHREAAVGLGIAALIFLISSFFDAPLGSEAHPGMSPNPAKAAWYFMGLQELLLHLHPTFGVFVVPLCMAGSLALLPYISGSVLPQGHWFGNSGSCRRAALLSPAIGLVPIGIALFIEQAASAASTVGPAAWVTRGALPLAGYFGLLAVWYLVCRTRLKCSRAQSLTGLVLSVFGTAAGLTIIGIWFRGPEMSLIWPL